MTGITIEGTGHYLPQRSVANEEFTAFLDTSDEWIHSHTGISQRRIALDEPSWYMGAMAAEQALAAAGIEAEAIDMIVCTTVTPDYYYPSMACLVQHHIGAKEAFCFDIAAACAGFPYALDLCRRYLVTGGAKRILLVSAERLSQVTNYQDRTSCILFGDGAGACVLTEGEGLFAAYLRSDGNGVSSIYARHPAPSIPFFDRTSDYHLDPFPAELLNLTYMDGHNVYRFATKAMAEAVTAACQRAGITPEELDLILPHQANQRIIDKAAKLLKFSAEKVYSNIQEYGNTSSASIPICLDECVRKGRLLPGHKVCVVGFGAGLVYGACVFQYNQGAGNH